MNQAPTADAGADRTVEATSPAGASVTLTARPVQSRGRYALVDLDGSVGAGSGVSPTVTLPLGTSTVTLTVDDGQATGTDTVAITVVAAVPADVVIDETTPSRCRPPINVPACLLLVGTIRPMLVMPNLVSVGNCVNISNNPALTDVDISVDQGVGGSVTIVDNTAAANVDISVDQGVGGSVTVVDNTAAANVDIDVVGGIGGSVTVIDNSAASSIDIGATAIVGDVTVSGNGESSVTVGCQHDRRGRDGHRQWEGRRWTSG